jgi:regulatory protein
MRSVASEPPPDPADPDADPESVARAIALRMLEHQPRTRVELERAMSRREVPRDVAAAVLDRFTEVGLVDDQAFATAWVDSRHRGRGLAKRALSAELRRRGVAEDVVREAVQSVSVEDEEVAARALVERKLRTMTNVAREAQLRRLVAMLGRKGFNQGLAMTVVRDSLNAE